MNSRFWCYLMTIFIILNGVSAIYSLVNGRYLVGLLNLFAAALLIYIVKSDGLYKHF